MNHTKNFIIIISLGLLLTGCASTSIPSQNDFTASEEIVNTTTTIETEEIPQNNDTQNIEGDLYYIKNITTKDNKIYIELDGVEWLSSIDETCSTSLESTNIPQCNPNGFLIQNSNLDLKTYEVSPSVIIQTTNFGSDPSASTNIIWQDFIDSFVEQKEYFEIVPFIIRIENNIITGIQERYLP